jgi:hypothetical protein
MVVLETVALVALVVLVAEVPHPGQMETQAAVELQVKDTQVDTLLQFTELTTVAVVEELGVLERLLLEITVVLVVLVLRQALLALVCIVQVEELEGLSQVHQEVTALALASILVVEGIPPLILVLEILVS